MNGWSVLGYGVAGAAGALAFLRIVSTEVATKRRLIEWRAETRRMEERQRRNAQAESQIHESAPA